jgi:hypothetical protein
MSDEPVPKVRYYVRCRDGDFILEIPADYKVTFAAVNPASQMTGRDLHCMRVYDGPSAQKANLRAVFNNVSGFRDLSLPVARKITRETGSATWARDDDQTLFEEKRELESEWRDDDNNPDIPF